MLTFIYINIICFAKKSSVDISNWFVMAVLLEITFWILAGINLVNSSLFEEAVMKGESFCLKNPPRFCHCTVEKNPYSHLPKRYQYICSKDPEIKVVMDIEYIPKNRIHIRCRNIPYIDAFPDLTEYINTTVIDLDNCTVPNNRSYYDYTHKISKNMKKLHLIIGYNDEDRNFNVNNFEGLSSLENIHIRVQRLITFRLPLENVFEKLVELKILEVQNLPTPNGIFDSLKKLQYLYIRNHFLMRYVLQFGLFKNQIELTYILIEASIISIEPNVFENLIELETLILNRNMFKSLPENLLQHNQKLYKFELTNNYKTIENLPRKFFANLWHLKNIELKSNNHEFLPEDLFKNSTNIKAIKISDHKIKSLKRDIFKDQINLNLLDLSKNLLKDLTDGLFDSVSLLKELNLSHNKLASLSV